VLKIGTDTSFIMTGSSQKVFLITGSTSRLRRRSELIFATSSRASAYHLSLIYMLRRLGLDLL